MADDLTINIRFYYSNDGTVIDEQVEHLQVDVSGELVTHTRQSVGTSEEALDLSGVTAGGYVYAINRDATNYVEIRSGTGETDLIRLKAGEPAIFRLTSTATAPYVIANSSACELEYWVLSD